MENAGDFILIFVICLIPFKEKHLLFHCMHCFVSMYLSGRKSLFNVLSLSSKHGVSSVPCIVWSTVSMSFYCWNTYLYWEYLIPLITVILSHRALLISELEKTTPPPPGCEFHVEMQKSGGRGEERLVFQGIVAPLSTIVLPFIS